MKNGSPFTKNETPDKRTIRFFFPTRGFAEIGATKDMVVIGQMSGDGIFWKQVAEVLALERGITHLGSWLVRNPETYIKLFGVEIENVKESIPDMKRYYGKFKGVMKMANEVMFKFDLQRFGGGGKGGVTYNTQSYEPTEYELQLQSLQVNYVHKIMPNTYDLNDIAMNMLRASELGILEERTITNEDGSTETTFAQSKLNYAEHLNQAITRYDEAYEKLRTGAGWISAYLSEMENHGSDFETINADFENGMNGAWESESFKTDDGAAEQYPGFFDYAAHILYGHAEKAMDEIATTLRTVSNGVHQHFHDVVGQYQDAA